MDVDANDEVEDIEILDWCSYVHTFDVVITTYAVLRTDFNVARAAPDRPRREDVVYTNVERPRSPLVMVEWNRVVMDEVQMVGGGQTEFVDFISCLSYVAYYVLQRYGFSYSPSLVVRCFGNPCTCSCRRSIPRTKVSNEYTIAKHSAI